MEMTPLWDVQSEEEVRDGGMEDSVRERSGKQACDSQAKALPL